MEKSYNFPIIVLFGSYSKALDNEQSDIDIFVLSNINKEFNTLKYEEILKRKVSIHLHSKKNLEKLKRHSKEFVNNLCNGITLSGQLEVLW